ncbi:arginyl-tRNA synthetase [Nematocida sp. AWRm77]|nr:arginyl-tRNA synthetase [Nematocida sp. AWRm77]
MEKAKEEIKRLLKSFTKFTDEALEKAVMKSRNQKNGDFLVPFSQLTKDKDVVKEVAEQMEKAGSALIKHVHVHDQILSVYVETKEIARDVILTVLSQKEEYGSSGEGGKKTVLVEFSSPNIAKIFHAGHLRTTVIGNYVYNIHKKMGYNAVAINYLGDWGKQFGLLGIGFEKYGSEEKMKENPITHLHEIYVQVNRDAETDETVHERAREFFRQMEEGNKDALALWKTFRDLSIAKYKSLYAQMNVHFDVYSGESRYGGIGLKDIQTRPYAQMSEDGSCFADLGALGKLVLVKDNGSTLYITRDIAAAEDRIKEYSPSKIIYVVASQQDLHFKQLFKMLEMEGKDPSLFLHISYGMVKGMSTRKGKAVFLEDIIAAAKEAVMEKIEASGKADQIEDKEHTSLVLAMSAIVIQDFRAKRIKDYEFDMKKNTAFVGDTGPYVQYTVCRLASISRNSPYEIGNAEDLDFAHLESEKAYDLVYALGKYPSVLKESIKVYEPSVIVTYIFQLCQMVNSIFRNVWVANQPEHIARPRLAMYTAAHIVLSDALKILGIVPLDRM